MSLPQFNAMQYKGWSFDHRSNANMGQNKDVTTWQILNIYFDPSLQLEFLFLFLVMQHIISIPHPWIQMTTNDNDL